MKTKRFPTKLLLATVVPLATLCWTHPLPLQAQITTVWEETAPGIHDFLDPDNWSDGVPGDEDVAWFNQDSEGTYTISFTAPLTEVRQFRLRNFAEPGFTGVDVTFDMGGNTVQALGGALDDIGIAEAGIWTESREDRGPYTLNLTNGTLKAGAMNIAWAGDAHLPATLKIGSGATLESIGKTWIGNATNSTGIVRVENGGRWEDDLDDSVSGAGDSWIFLGRGGGTTGIIQVDGNGSVADMNAAGDNARSMVLGESGTGTIEVTNGGKFIGADQVQLGRSAENASGSILVSGEGSEFQMVRNLGVGGITVGPGSPDSVGTGLVRVEDEGQMTVTGSGTHIFENGTVEIDNGTLSLGGTSEWWAGSTYKLTLHDPEVAPIIAGGGITLVDNEVILSLELGPEFSPEVGDEFYLFDYASSLTGEFDGLPQDALIAVGPYEFRIDYGSRSGGDIAFLEVTVIPEPTSIAYLLVGVGLFLGVVRRRGRTSG